MSTYNVWFILVDHNNHPISLPSKVLLLGLDDIDDLKEKVMEKEKLSIPASRLKVWRCTNPEVKFVGEDVVARVQDVFSKNEIQYLDEQQEIAGLQIKAKEILLVQVQDIQPESSSIIHQHVPCSEDDPPISSLIQQRRIRLSSVGNPPNSINIPVIRDASQLTLDYCILPRTPSRVAYRILSTLEWLATAPDAILMDVFGSVVTRWQGADGTLEREVRVKKEKEWVSARSSEPDVPEKLKKIRVALASARICAIDARYFEALTGDHCGATAIHHRDEATKDVIFITQLLTLVDNTLDFKRKSSQGAHFEESGAAMALYAFKLAIHEAIHLAGTALYGVAYETPGRLHCATFADKEECESWGEAGEWFEQSKLGAFLSFHIVLPSPSPSAEEGTTETDWRIALTGSLPGSSAFYEVAPETLKWAVERITSSEPETVFSDPPLFSKPLIVPVINYLASLDDLEDGATVQDLIDNLKHQSLTRRTRACHSGASPSPGSHQWRGKIYDPKTLSLEMWYKIGSAGGRMPGGRQTRVRI